MHYRTINVNYEMLSCITEVLKDSLYKEISRCGALGVQINGFCDRQQLGIKFITARLVKEGKMSTRFLAAVEPVQKDAMGLLEALGSSLVQPGDAYSQSDEFTESSGAAED